MKASIGLRTQPRFLTAAYLGRPRRLERPVVALLGGDRLVGDLGVVGRGESGEAEDHRQRAERGTEHGPHPRQGDHAGRVAQIFSTMRSPYRGGERRRAVEGEADLVDDAGQAEQVLRARASGHSDRPGSSTGKTYSVASSPRMRARKQPRRTSWPWRVSPRTGRLGIGKSRSFAFAAGIVVISVPESTTKRQRLPGPWLVLTSSSNSACSDIDRRCSATSCGLSGTSSLDIYATLITTSRRVSSG